MQSNILQYESKIWATADLLRGCGIKESEWPSFMMPFFALIMIESRLVRLRDELYAEYGAEFMAGLEIDELQELVGTVGQGYNKYIFEQIKTLKDVCQNDKSFENDFYSYLNGFDGETKDLLGVETQEGKKYLDIKGVIAKLRAKRVLFSYAKEWSGIDLRPFNNSEITTLEEHIKRKWADISAETAGEQYTPDDVIMLIADIIAAKIDDSDRLLKIYDCTCGGGNLLFGVDDRIKEKMPHRFTQTFGQDWNDALFAFAKIESRFRDDSEIGHGNTLTEDRFPFHEMDVVVANPPYGVDWKGYRKDIRNDKTGRFHYLPSVSDGQLLFMQHLVSKMTATGIGVVVHNGSTLFSGDAGSAESNIRKWLLDQDIVEAIIQLPTDEFFNTGIHTYLWVLNQNKADSRRDKVMLINASQHFAPLKKSRGSKRREIDRDSRHAIVAALEAYTDNDFARVFDKHFFYYNKQAIELTNVDADGNALPKRRKLQPTSVCNGADTFTELTLTEAPNGMPLKQYYDEELKPLLKGWDYKIQPVCVTTPKASYSYDGERETLLKTTGDITTPLGCGKIVVKPSFKKQTKTQPDRIMIDVSLTPDTEKDYEIIRYHADSDANQQAIADFMAKYISKPFSYLNNVIGVEINFNKVFYEPVELPTTEQILREIEDVNARLAQLERLSLS